MPSGTTPLLERHARFHSHALEPSLTYLDSRGFRLDLAKREAPALDIRVNGCYLPGMYLGYTQYGAPVTVHAKHDCADYWLILPTRGRLEARVAGRNVACDPRRAVLTHPRRSGHVIASELGCGRLNVVLTETAVAAQLVALLGQPIAAAPEFAPELDVTAGYGRGLAGFLRLAIADFEQDGPLLGSAIAMTEFQQFILSGLLLSHPHSYSEALRRLERPVAPRAVKRAIDYIHANLQSAITLDELVAAAGVAGRTLFKHFRDFKGTSPMRYLRNARLSQVREILQGADRDTRVADVALSWGFSHLGRFSVDYRRRYGETPTATMRRGRSHVGQ
jgi:AraC-like DNA-binding protein